MTQVIADGTLVLIRWLDSMAYDRWDRIDTIRANLIEQAGGLEHLTVGWKIDEGEHHVIVASSRHSTEPVWNGVMAIPKVAILSVQAFDEERDTEAG